VKQISNAEHCRKIAQRRAVTFSLMCMTPRQRHAYWAEVLRKVREQLETKQP
jgi:hypothetical protein